MLKRIIDIILSLLVIIISSPLITLILLLVYLITGENPILIQERKISLDKKFIRIIKIRTIKDSKQFRELEQASDKIFIKKEYREFVPAFCKWLRKTGLDEMLQVINVLKGEMSFAGPRPLLETELIIMKEHEPSYYNRRKAINSKPGITGFWQINGDRLKGTKNLIELDEVYEKKKSFLFDLNILLKTFFIIITASHSDAIVIDNDKNKMIGKINILDKYENFTINFWCYWID